MLAYHQHTAEPAARWFDNNLLAALPPDERDHLVARGAVVHLAAHQTLTYIDERINYVYFPLTGLASVTTLMADGGTVEVGMIGREGTTGLSAFFGATTSPLITCVQVAGDFIRLPIDTFREGARPGTALSRLLLRFTHAYSVLTAQSAGCNQLHSHVERCARWLLLTQDRIGGDTFPLSHEHLATTLGTRRASITLAMGALRVDGLIAYRHGVVTIVDRPGLEASACECYAVIRGAFDR